MAQNPLLGKRISLISKKNIRYEGLLYSINEQNATVALQNVRSFGTEGREETDGSITFVAPTMEVHPYLLFRGQDIKDLHVHDESPSESSDITQQPSSDTTQQNEPQQDLQQPPKHTADKPQTAAAATRSKPSATSTPTARTVSDPSPPPPPVPITQTEEISSTVPGAVVATDGKAGTDDSVRRPKQGGSGRGDGKNRRGPKGPAVGTGASLLNRRARGVVKDGHADVVVENDFDFQSNLEQLKKEETADDEAGDTTGLDGSTSSAAKSGTCYEKDSFFDTISCDALDKEHGVDNRLRGTAERQLNTETFGAVALNAGGPGGYYRRGGGRSGGRSGGRGGGRSSVGRGGNSNNNPSGRGRGEGRGGGQFSSSRGDGSGRTSRGRGGGRGRRSDTRAQSDDRPIPQVTAS